MLFSLFVASDIIFAYSIPSNSTVKISAAYGGMFAPAPRSPYANWYGK